MANEYDISKAFKRIENDLIDSMMRNMARHQAEETEMGINWEQWQVLQLKELERYRKENIKKFGGDFSEINNRIEDLFRQTSADAMAQEEAKILDDIRKGRYYRQKKDVTFFNVNDQKLDVLIERTKADFSRAEYAVLRKADDQYRQIIYDAQVYGNVTNDYAKAVDMATHDFLQKGIQSVQYKNGAKHNISEYSEMAIRTGNKRAYLMGEGNAHDEFGIHTIRVNKRTQACPLCVGFLGKVMVDDVYAGGTPKEAMKLGVPLLSQAIDEGFLHPNCKDIYSMYIDGISKEPEPWTQEEIETIVSKYNAEQELKRAEDMQESYARMAKYSLDPSNKAKYQARADGWQTRVDDIKNGMPPQPITPPKPVEPPKPAPAMPQATKPFTDDEKDALEWYVSGDGMWINQYLRGIGDFGELSEEEKKLYDLLKQATNRPLEGNADVLYRSVDASAIFKGLSSDDLDNLMEHILYGDSKYDKGAYSQSLKQRMESIISNAQGKEITEKGFMSTTVDKTVAENWGDFTDAQHPIVLELDTAGVELKGADLDSLDIADDPQRERLLAPDVRYKITDIGVGEYENGGKYIKIKAEILDQAVEEVADAVEKTDTFVPATTIKEANEYAQRFCDTSRFGALGISYDGVSVDIANIANKTIGEFFDTYEVEPFGGIIAPKGNTKLGKLVDGATAGYSPIRHSFLLNRKELKDVALAEKKLREELDVVKRFIAHPERFDLSKVSTVVRKTLQASTISGRGTAELTVKEVLWHELGHALEKGVAKSANYETIKANMAVYAPKISGYATTDLGEYIAESFCSYKKGEGLVDPELVKAFDALRRK